MAEGAEEGALDIKLEKGTEKDAGGHVKHGDIGQYLSKRLNEYAKERGVTLNIKYIDPTYSI